jgi:hypothetical protein
MAEHVSIHWAEICKAAYVLGLMEDFSKGECLRLAKQLNRLVEEGKVVRVSRGVYRKDHPDARPGLTDVEEPEDEAKV